MCKLALDQRNEWRDSLRKGIIPPEIQYNLDLYRLHRDDQDWRSSSMYEGMAEMALILEDIINAKQ